MPLSIQTILVPQGAEYQAVCRGLSRANVSKPEVIAIPIGSQSLLPRLQAWQRDGGSIEPRSNVLVMGLCGSLTPRYHPGDIVLYHDCTLLRNGTTSSVRECDRDLTALLHALLEAKATMVKSLTSDRVIWSAEEKRRLGEQYSADVVDMEGFGILDAFDRTGTAVAMLRVVSDGSHHDIPNLDLAIAPDGSLRSWPLARQMLRQPIAATRLIRGSLKGLKSVEQVTTVLFKAIASGHRIK